MTLSDLSNLDRQATALRYQPPDWIESRFDESFPIPGYPESSAHLVIYRCQSRLADERTPWRDSGVLVAGRNAIHQATYFGLENRSGAFWFMGRLDCPIIDSLQDDYDRCEEKGIVPQRNNPFALLTRTRDGLEPTHPFTLALKREFEARLAPLIDEIEREEARQADVESEDTRRRLNNCAKAMEEEFRRIAEERELEVDTGSDDTQPVDAVALEVIPSTFRLDPGGGERRLAIRVWPAAWTDESLPEPTVATVQCDSPEIVVSPEEVILTPDPRQPGRLRGVVTVASSTDEEDSYTVTVTLGSRSFSVICNVEEEQEPEPPSPPERLEFRPGQCTMVIGRKRRLRLRAPLEAVGSRDPVVGVRTTVGVAAPSELTLETVTNADGDTWWEARLAIEAAAPGSWRLRAELGDQVASCRVLVRDSQVPRFDFRLRKEAPRYPGEGRSRWSAVERVNVCYILTGHHSLARYFTNRASKAADDQDQERRVLLAEVIADAMTTFSLLHSTDAGASGAPSFGYFTSERNKLVDRFLRVAQRYVATQGIPEEA